MSRLLLVFAIEVKESRFARQRISPSNDTSLPSHRLSGRRWRIWSEPAWLLRTRSTTAFSRSHPLFLVYLEQTRKFYELVMFLKSMLESSLKWTPKGRVYSWAVRTKNNLPFTPETVFARRTCRPALLLERRTMRRLSWRRCGRVMRSWRYWICLESTIPELWIRKPNMSQTWVKRLQWNDYVLLRVHFSEIFEKNCRPLA